MNIKEKTEALKLADKAFREYDLNGHSMKPIGQSGSYVFLITGKERYVLKLHTHARNDLRSAMNWLDALSRETCMAVPSPICNRQDDLVTYLDYDGQKLPATLHKWVEGKHYPGTPGWGEHRPISFPADLSCRVGKMIAEVHTHSKSWEIPCGFVRPTWDLDWMCSYLSGLETKCEEGIITKHEFTLIKRAAAKACETLKDFQKTKTSWGIIHGDLNPLNVIVHDNEVRPLDFDLCGYGYFLQDISYLFLWLTPDNRQHLIQGYQKKQPLPNNYRELLVSFLIFSLIPMLKFWLPNPKLLDEMCNEYLHDRLRIFSD